MGDTIREQLEKLEEKTLSKYATKSTDSKGREVEEKQCDIRPVFQRDRDRIIHCKAFRRLKNKTQVFLDPVGDHYRTRLSHTLEVSQIGRTISKALLLNEDLTEAIALAHDLGHTPFGHAGERTLNRLVKGGFAHNEQSKRIVEFLEKEGKGLNLTWEVRDGIQNHRLRCTPHTPEGFIVRLSDKIAYINSDMDDAIRAGILTEDDIPKEIRKVLGNSVKARLNTLVHDAIKESTDSPDIKMSKEVYEAMIDLRKFMFDHVYTNPVAKKEEIQADRLLTELFNYYMNNEYDLPLKFKKMITKENPLDRVIADYISGMTDQFAINTFNDIFMPKAWDEGRIYL